LRLFEISLKNAPNPYIIYYYRPRGEGGGLTIMLLVTNLMPQTLILFTIVEKIGVNSHPQKFSKPLYHLLLG
jgi:hypothetical protein